LSPLLTPTCSSRSLAADRTAPTLSPCTLSALVVQCRLCRTRPSPSPSSSPSRCPLFTPFSRFPGASYRLHPSPATSTHSYTTV
jgi:hypothetical protein